MIRKLLYSLETLVYILVCYKKMHHFNMFSSYVLSSIVVNREICWKNWSRWKRGLGTDHVAVLGGWKATVAVKNGNLLFLWHTGGKSGVKFELQNLNQNKMIKNKIKRSGIPGIQRDTFFCSVFFFLYPVENSQKV